MKIKKVLNEIAESGIVPLVCGSGILLTNPPRLWAVYGLACTLMGLWWVYESIQKASVNNQGERSQ